MPFCLPFSCGSGSPLPLIIIHSLFSSLPFLSYYPFKAQFSRFLSHFSGDKNKFGFPLFFSDSSEPQIRLSDSIKLKRPLPYKIRLFLVITTPPRGATGYGLFADIRIRIRLQSGYGYHFFTSVNIRIRIRIRKEVRIRIW